MNPVCSLTPSVIISKFEGTPEFELQGSEFVVKLANPNSYIKLDSGIMYEDAYVDPGDENSHIIRRNNQKVTSFGEDKVVDVTLYVVEKPGFTIIPISDPSTDPNSSIAGELQILRLDAMQGWSSFVVMNKTLNNILSCNNFHVLLFLFHLVALALALSMLNSYKSTLFDTKAYLLKLPISQLYDV
ncbi:hypothetical protein ACFE04_026664 [Oxalis oulophora]